MKTYEFTYVTEATITVRVREESPEAAGVKAMFEAKDRLRRLNRLLPYYAAMDTYLALHIGPETGQ